MSSAAKKKSRRKSSSGSHEDRKSVEPSVSPEMLDPLSLMAREQGLSGKQVSVVRFVLDSQTGGSSAKDSVDLDQVADIAHFCATHSWDEVTINEKLFSGELKWSTRKGKRKQRSSQSSKEASAGSGAQSTAGGSGTMSHSHSTASVALSEKGGGGSKKKSKRRTSTPDSSAGGGFDMDASKKKKKKTTSTERKGGGKTGASTTATSSAASTRSNTPRATGIDSYSPSPLAAESETHTEEVMKMKANKYGEFEESTLSLSSTSATMSSSTRRRDDHSQGSRGSRSPRPRSGGGRYGKGARGGYGSGARGRGRGRDRGGGHMSKRGFRQSGSDFMGGRRRRDDYGKPGGGRYGAREGGRTHSHSASHGEFQLPPRLRQAFGSGSGMGTRPRRDDSKRKSYKKAHTYTRVPPKHSSFPQGRGIPLKTSSGHRLLAGEVRSHSPVLSPLPRAQSEREKKGRPMPVYTDSPPRERAEVRPPLVACAPAVESEVTSTKTDPLPLATHSAFGSLRHKRLTPPSSEDDEDEDEEDDMLAVATASQPPLTDQMFDSHRRFEVSSFNNATICSTKKAAAPAPTSARTTAARPPMAPMRATASFRTPTAERRPEAVSSNSGEGHLLTHSLSPPRGFCLPGPPLSQVSPIKEMPRGSGSKSSTGPPTTSGPRNEACELTSRLVMPERYRTDLATPGFGMQLGAPSPRVKNNLQQSYVVLPSSYHGDVKQGGLVLGGAIDNNTTMSPPTDEIGSGDGALSSSTPADEVSRGIALGFPLGFPFPREEVISDESGVMAAAAVKFSNLLQAAPYTPRTSESYQQSADYSTGASTPASTAGGLKPPVVAPMAPATATATATIGTMPTESAVTAFAAAMQMQMSSFGQPQATGWPVPAPMSAAAPASTGWSVPAQRTRKAVPAKSTGAALSSGMTSATLPTRGSVPSLASFRNSSLAHSSSYPSKLVSSKPPMKTLVENEQLAISSPTLRKFRPVPMNHSAKSRAALSAKRLDPMAMSFRPGPEKVPTTTAASGMRTAAPFSTAYGTPMTALFASAPPAYGPSTVSAPPSASVTPVTGALTSGLKVPPVLVSSIGAQPPPASVSSLTPTSQHAMSVPMVSAPSGAAADKLGHSRSSTMPTAASTAAANQLFNAATNPLSLATAAPTPSALSTFINALGTQPPAAFLASLGMAPTSGGMKHPSAATLAATNPLWTSMIGAGAHQPLTYPTAATSSSFYNATAPTTAATASIPLAFPTAVRSSFGGYPGFGVSEATPTAGGSAPAARGGISQGAFYTTGFFR